MKATRKKQSAAVTSEGPYELGVAPPGGMFQNRDVGRFTDFFVQLQEEAKRAFGISSGQREMPIILDLIRNHFAGRLVTSSALAAASGLSYGTAIRTIRSMAKRGLIVKRARTTTGRSSSLHPSGELVSRWHIYSHRGEQLVRSLLKQPPHEQNHVTRRRGYPDAVNGILPPPTVLETKLDLGRAPRVLVHGDPTFTAMHALKKQFEMILVALHSDYDSFKISG